VKRVAFLISIVSLLSLGLAAPVLAAAPGNDTYGTRTVVAGIPFAETIDTFEATADADDAEANAQCGAPAVDASVWYEYTATSDGGLLVDVSGSSYSAGIIVATGSPGNLSVIACAAPALGLKTAVGETYAILIFDYQGDGGGDGGSLSITIADVPPPPEVEVTVNSNGRFDARTGAATVSGTATCSGADESGHGFIEFQLSQSVGRFKVFGWGFAEFACDGGTHGWTAEIVSGDGKFAGGKATLVAFVSACNIAGCADTVLQTVVSLRK
jgi:hypothetical protein